MPLKQTFLLRTLMAVALGCASLAVGVGSIVPPYVAGAKFRTPENIETVLATDLAARLQRF